MIIKLPNNEIHLGPWEDADGIMLGSQRAEQGLFYHGLSNRVILIPYWETEGNYYNFVPRFEGQYLSELDLMFRKIYKISALPFSNLQLKEAQDFMDTILIKLSNLVVFT